MAEKLELIGQINDLSTPRGFQFEFRCNRCGSGYRSAFKASVTGGVSEVLGAAAGIFGGIFGTAHNVGDRIHDATWKKGRDEAYREAMTELTPFFVQCPRCNVWVCRERCWNTRKGLCKECAPDLGVEMAKAQSDRSVEEIHAHAAMAEEDKKLATENWRQNITASCPRCESPLATNAKFCPQCGEELKKENLCPGCRSKLTPGAKFCPECGRKTG